MLSQITLQWNVNKGKKYDVTENKYEQNILNLNFNQIH